MTVRETIVRRVWCPGIKRRGRFAGYGFLLPTLLVLAGVVVLPLGFSLAVSFSSYTFIRPRFGRFQGIANYIAGLSNEYFWNSVWVTLRFVVMVVALEFVLGFGIALLLNREIRFKGVFYTVLTMPMVMAPIAVGLIWKMLLHPDLGIVNYVLSEIGLPPVDWLGSPGNALITLVLVDIWQQISFMILVLLAGLVSLPKEPFEAATIDGASPLQVFRFVTLPLMRPVIATAVLIRTIFAFRTYDLVYVMTRGGPGTSTDVISYYIYKTTFMGLDLAQASALSWVLLLVVLLMVVPLFRYLNVQSASL
ncbi:MAG: sugar ABC transporter permease [Limnochordaceae bacterium]|nr:sugar ABC transporter permease [Limnochordaceae bacterium]